jgi:hypothetical protein
MSLYGDHHVIEVRRILLDIPGVSTVYASSAFHVVEVSYDPTLVDSGAIMAALEAEGYLQDWSVPVESGAPASLAERTAFFRQTSPSQQPGHPVNFSQPVDKVSWGLWPCPGMDPIKPMDNGE